MDARQFTKTVASLRSQNSFNPYSDICPVADRSNSADIRLENLYSVLNACLRADKCSLWIGRDLGYRGGRRTGVPLTDEVFLSSYGKAIGATNLQKATKGPAIGERTAAVVQSIIGEISSPVFMWNVFPLHPYSNNDPMTNRKHTAAEREMSRFAIRWLVENLKIDVVIAIGRDAEAALIQMDVPCVAARHPSYGGQTDFLAKMKYIYKLRDISKQQLSFI